MSGKGAGGGRQQERDEESEPPTSPPRPTANGGKGGGSSDPPYRGLGSGLAKAAPSSDGLSQKTYRSFRRRLELFQMQCKRRPRDAEVEGALLVVSLLKDSAWEACEQLDLQEVQQSNELLNRFVHWLLPLTS